MNKKQKKIAYVFMLDTSLSMRNVMEQLRINAKAFVACSFAGDQFAVCQFYDKANWVYPPSATLVTVSEGAALEVLEACRCIDSLQDEGITTNIGAAIQLAKEAIVSSTADFDAFVLMSDGEHLSGPEPDTVLGDTPPIFIAGMGPFLKPGYFDKMKDKNPLSQVIMAKNYSDMMLLFNMLRGSIPGVQLLKNERITLLAKTQTVFPVDVKSAKGMLRISVVWPATRFCYSAQQNVPNTLCVYLVAPDGAQANATPFYAQGGFCVFNTEIPFTGEWNVHIENNFDEQCDTTLGVFFVED